MSPLLLMPQPSPFRSGKHLLVLAALLLLAAGLRLFALEQTTVDSPVRADAKDYFFYGLNLSESGVYSRDSESLYKQETPAPDAARAPAYGFFISVFLDKQLAWGNSMEALAASIRPVLVAQTLLGILTVGLVFLAAGQLLPLWAATLAGLLTALSPHLINASNYLLSETLFAFFFTLFLTQVAFAKSPLHYAGAGLTLGLATLTRPTTEYLPLLILLAIPLLVDRSHWRRWLSLALAAFVLTALWKLRNLAAIGSTSDPQLLANTIHHGMYPDFMHNGLPESLGIPYDFDPDLAPGEPRLGVILSTLWARFLEGPGEYLHWYLVGKPLALFRWDILPFQTFDGRLLVAGDIYLYPTIDSPFASNPLFILTYVVSKLAHVPALLLATGLAIYAWLPACRVAWPQQTVFLRILSLSLVYVVAIHCIGAPFPRYSVSFLPLVFLLASSAVALVVQWARRVRQASVEAMP